MPAYHVSKDNYLHVVESYTIGHYRGEDSGAIYPEYEFRDVEMYNLNPIKNCKIRNKTIEELVQESCRQYPYAGEMFTSPQAKEIYSYIETLEDVSNIRIL